MPDEFKPEASVDFESWITEAAPPNGNGGGPTNIQPPPEQDRPADPPRPPVNPQAARNSAPRGGDPILQLQDVAINIPLIYRELGDINAGLMRAQVTNALTLGSMLLLAVVVWKLSTAAKGPAS